MATEAATDLQYCLIYLPRIRNNLRFLSVSLTEKAQWLRMSASEAFPVSHIPALVFPFATGVWILNCNTQSDMRRLNQDC